MTAFRHRSLASASDLIGHSPKFIGYHHHGPISSLSIPNPPRTPTHDPATCRQLFDYMYSFAIERIKEHLLDFKSNISSHQKELWRYRVHPITGPIPYVSKYLNRLGVIL